MSLVYCLLLFLYYDFSVFFLVEFAIAINGNPSSFDYEQMKRYPSQKLFVKWKKWKKKHSRFSVVRWPFSHISQLFQCANVSDENLFSKWFTKNHTHDTQQQHKKMRELAWVCDVYGLLVVVIHRVSIFTLPKSQRKREKFRWTTKCHSSLESVSFKLTSVECFFCDDNDEKKNCGVLSLPFE